MQSKHTDDTEEGTSTKPTKLKHSNSVPVKKRQEMLNPLLFRNSRSNIYDLDIQEEREGEASNSANDTKSKAWTIENIEEVPTIFQIQRTNCTIQDLTPDKVASNISQYLNEVAVSTLYDDENAVAHAELGEDLRILVRLFKVKGDGGVLVEVSRRDGCSAQYHSEAMKILHAAKGLDVKTLSVDNNDSKPRSIDVSSDLRSQYLKQMKIT